MSRRAWIPVAEFASETGRTARAVRKACADGRLGDAARKGADGRSWEVHRKRAEQFWQSTTDPTKQRENPGKPQAPKPAIDEGPAPELVQEARAAAAEGDLSGFVHLIAASSGDYREQNALRLELDNYLALLKLQREQGDLLPREEVERAKFHAGRVTRDRVLTVASAFTAALGPVLAKKLERDLVAALQGASAEIEGDAAA